MDKWFVSAVICGEYMYWITEINGHFMKMNINTNKVSFCYPEGLKNRVISRSTFVCCKDNILYAIAEKGKWLIKYNVTDNCCEYLELNQENINLDLYAGSYIKDELLFVIPVLSSNIIAININNGKVEYISYGEEDDRESLDKIYSAGNSVLIDNEIIFSKYEYFCLYELSMNDLTCVNKYENKTIKNVVSIAYDSNAVIILTEKGDVFALKNGEYCKMYDGNTNEEAFKYNVLCKCDSKLWIMPGFGQDILCINELDNSINIYDYYPNSFVYDAPSGMAKYTHIVESDDIIYFAMHAGNDILAINKKSGDLLFLNVRWPSVDEWNNEIIFQRKPFFVEGQIALDVFIDKIGKTEI